MQISKRIIVLILFTGLAFMGFQCSSTELTSAKLYIQQKNYDKALESLKSEVSKNPKSDEGYYWLGVVYSEKENYDEMLKAFDASLAISKKFETHIEDSKKYAWANLFNKGVSSFQRGNNTDNEDSIKIYYERSIYQFENAVLMQPDSSDTYKNLAFVYINAERPDDAIKPLQKIIDLEKELDGYRLLGKIYYDKGSDKMSEFKSSKNLADSSEAINQFNKAIQVLEDGRKTYPNDQQILLYLSNSYIGANKIDVAIDAFKTGVEQEPENKYYRYNYGVLLLGADRFDEAVVQFTKAVDIDPEYQNAIYNLGVTYVKWGTHLNKLAEDKGETSSEYKSKYEMALPHLEKVVDMKSDDAATWELLGRVYGVLGMTEKAEDAFDKADKLNK
ncbi:MAG: tetratricopeptide repeat protein [Ignavibacteriales bacterium]|nr:MAG: tetratricopeptide repeat protein [Ignavibacteriales bacterium]